MGWFYCFRSAVEIYVIQFVRVDTYSDSDLFYFVGIQHTVTVMYIKIKIN